MQQNNTKGFRIFIAEARFYQDISDQLAQGVTAVLDEAGAQFERVAVPGSFELPAAIRFAHDRGCESGGQDSFDGYIALGCVIRGETDHYDHVCRETSRALMDLAVQDRLALGFGLLTCETYDQALIRAKVDGKNRGADAARACLRMIELRHGLRGQP
ncbi:MAG: 6,7-dimethyl-8-ribityllumazine synthase [Hyphomicrobiales bacterium]|nr:6,7-dimethyl-8-ribityllumazine synthase [Hyphomicrobiales bacterium]